MTEDTLTNHLSVSFPNLRLPWATLRYTYKNTDLSIKVGDEVLLPGGRTGLVTSTNMTLNPSAPFEYKSITGRVSRPHHD